MVDVVSMGELLVEFVSSADNVDLVNSPGFVKAPGGAPANVAVALTRLGTPAGFIGKVGDDPFGRYLRQSLDATGVDTRYLLVDDSARTTAVFVAVWDDGRKDLCFYRNPGADSCLTDIDIVPDMLAGSRCFHYGSVTLTEQPAANAQRKALALAKQQGLMISYDPNYRPTLWSDSETARRTIQDGFAHCHLAKVSEEEWAIASGGADDPDFSRGIDNILKQGVELLVISRGEQGAIATNGDYRIELPSPAVEAVETTGAGDGFMAGMIHQLLPERERLGSLAAIDRAKIADALRFATAVGALACTQRGAIPALPTLDQVEQFLEHN